MNVRDEHCYDVVIPTIGRPSLQKLLDILLQQQSAERHEVVVVDDRAKPHDRFELPSSVRVINACGRGPARARNLGWQASQAPWVVFLDDDVIPGPRWAEQLRDDLASASAATVGVQGRLVVPQQPGRRLSDWERNVATLEQARWATADMAFRRSALEMVGGFDERFPRAFREDADLALRVLAAGGELAVGHRLTFHPVRPADRWISIRLQRGNADDAMMRKLHGRSWRDAASAPDGHRFPLHLAAVGSALTALLLFAASRPRLGFLFSACWLSLTAEFAMRRILPGPRVRPEILTMLATSVVIPPVAVFFRVRQEIRLASGIRPWPEQISEHRRMLTGSNRLEIGRGTVGRSGSLGFHRRRVPSSNAGSPKSVANG